MINIVYYFISDYSPIDLSSKNKTLTSGIKHDFNNNDKKIISKQRTVNIIYIYNNYFLIFMSVNV